MAGLLIYEEFVRNARDLVAMSDRLGDGWELRHVRATDGPEETTFLVKRSCVVSTELHPVLSETSSDAGEPENIEDEDPATLPCGEKSQEAVNFEYHVIYSPSYQVPVLFFTATFHSGRLVPLRDIWRFVSPVHVTRESGMEWESVTQQDHPILCRPFYHIHPCHTSTIMATALTPNKDKEKLNYLLSWLTIFGPTIGLNVSIDYLQINSKT